MVGLMGTWQHRMTDVDPETRRGVCARCGPVSLKYKTKGDGTHRWACSIAEKKWSKKGHANWRISLAEREAFLEAQGGVCPLCLEAKPLVVDHCHETEVVRGLLCRSCNSRLGAVEGEWGNRANAYLQKDRTPPACIP